MFSAPSRKHNSVGAAALKAAAMLWVQVAVVGQLLFASYIVILYSPSALHADWEAWNRKHHPHPYHPGDTIGNVAFATHILLAVVVIASGVIQLTPKIRHRAPSLHRWSGRLYVLSAFTVSIGGLYLVWFRESTGDIAQHLGVSLNAVLIMACAALVMHYARARQFDTHRNWAIRLFLVVGGVWLFRVCLMLWFFLNGDRAGVDINTFRGPFLSYLTFAQSLLPLLVFELYLLTQKRGGALGRLAVAAGLLVLTCATGIGMFRVATEVWLPRVLG